MPDLTLKDSLGIRTLAKKIDISAAVATGITSAIGSVNYKQVIAKGKDNPSEGAPETEDTGFVEETVLAELTESTVQIPQNFAGLESVMVPTRLRNQFFEITEVHEMDGYVEITALHTFYQLRQNMTLWEANENTKYSGASAIRNVMGDTLFETGFKVASDSTDMIRGDELDYARTNIVEAFLNPESGICARYGLSIIRDNDVFYCLKDVGFDRGFVVQNKKNMLGVERTESIEDIITRVAPVGRDEEGEFVWLNRNGKKYIDSPHINEYATPRAEIYITDIEIGRDGVTAENIQDKLYEAAQKRFDEDEVDVPTVAMTVQFIALGDTEEYRQYKDLDKVYLYDVIHIKDTERGYTYGAQVIAVQHNVLTGLLESVTIGTPQPWDGVRKIGKWQVPEITKGKIRHGSIRSGEIADGAVKTDKIASGAVTAGHMSQSADGHFKTIFAEELYISNTSEDGLLNTRFSVSEGNISAIITKTGINSLGQSETLYGKLTVEAGKISQIVTAVGANGEVTAASIVTAINQTTGQGEVHIDADHVYINAGASGERNVVTEIGGKLVASDITASFLQAKISDITLLTVNALSVAGGIAAQGTLRVSGLTTLNGSLQLGSGNSFSKCLVSAVIDGNTLKITDSSGDVVNFSKATTLSGSWSGTTYTVTASPQGNTNSTTITLDLSGSANIIGAKVKNGNTELASVGAKLEENVSDKKVYCKLTSGSGSTIAQVSTSDTYSAGVAAGANGVTLSQGSWSNGALTVTASNGKTTTVSLPSVSSTTWENTTGNTWRTKLTIGGATRYSSTKDFSSLYTSGYNAGWNDAIDACGFTQGYFYAYSTNAYLYSGPMIPAGNGQWYPLADGYKTVPAKK